LYEKVVNILLEVRVSFLSKFGCNTAFLH